MMGYKRLWTCTITLLIITIVCGNCTMNNEQLSTEDRKCDCYNGGICSLNDKYMACNCPEGFIGTKCETSATLISEKDKEFIINQNYSYFYFQPQEINYYQIALKICLPENQINKLTNLVFLQVQRNTGKLKLQPSIYQTSPITFQGISDRCQTFYTHFIPIRKKLNDQFQKIIFGVAIKNNTDSTANKWVSFLQRTAANPEQSLRKNEIFNEQPNEEIIRNEIQIQHQKIYISCTYELYLVQNYWGTFIIIMSAITLIMSTGVFLYTIRSKYSYNLTNEQILHMYALNPEDFMNQQNLKNDLGHFRFIMPIMSYQLLVQKLTSKSINNNKQILRKKTLTWIIKNPQEQQVKGNENIQNVSLDQLKNREQRVNVTQKEGKEIQSTCTICLLDFEKQQKVRMTPCQHIFHSQCIDNWCENTLNCPVCRHNLQLPRKRSKRPLIITL